MGARFPSPLPGCHASRASSNTVACFGSKRSLRQEVQDTRRGLKSLLRSWRKQKEQKSKGTGHQSDDQGETLQV